MEKIKYRIYVDEIGTTHISKKDTEKFENRYLGLCGVIISESEQEKLRKAFLDLKNILQADKDLISKIYIHRKDILDKKGYFSILKDKNIEMDFNNKLLDIIIEIDFTIIFCAIDKIDHNKKYKDPVHPYLYMFDLLLEKYIYFLENNNGKGDIMFESRGKKENLLLEANLLKTLKSGHFIPNRWMDVNKIKDVITSKNIKFVEKVDSVSGVELADLLAIPCLFYILDKYKLKDFKKDSFNYKIKEIIYGSKLKDNNIKFMFYNV